LRPSIEHGVVFSVVNNLRIICNMGVDINNWRARNGLFSQPRESVLKFHGLKPSFGRFRLTFQLCTCLIALLIVCADIEENPGPGLIQKSSDNRRQSQLHSSQSAPSPSQQGSSASGPPRPGEPPTGRHVHVKGVQTRQRTISSYAHVVSSPPPSNNENRSDADIYSLLMSMKSFMRTNNHRILSDLDQMNSKIDDISDKVHELKSGYDSLRRESEQHKTAGRRSSI